MKKYIYILVCLVLCLNLSAQEYKSFTVLHTNDTHSCIEPFKQENGHLVGGYVRRATYIASMRDSIKNLLLFDCGDISQGSPYYNIFKGDVEISLMNAIGYDAMVIGNHEFDYGVDNMARIFRMAKFSIVCANYDFGTTPLAKIVKPYIVLHRFGLKIGVFGLSPELKGLVQNKCCEGVTYEDPIKAAQKVADVLKYKEKCDFIICLSHLGWDAIAQGLICDPALINQTRNIDMVLGGHSHTLIQHPIYYKNLDGKEIPNTQMGARGVYVGRMDIKLIKK
jgi:5'-nucleotidase